MIKNKLIVPAGIRFMSEWIGFAIPDYPCIIDKKIPGCGFTEYCITNSENVILCSPRKILLKNKKEQHPDDVFYVESIFDQDETVDKDLAKKLNRGSGRIPTRAIDLYTEEEKRLFLEKLKSQIIDYVNKNRISRKPIKILVTYDSFRLVKEFLKYCIEDFRVVIDEFQSIFTDSRFKSDTELSFMYHIQDLQKVCYLSATPMIDEYLEQLDEFKDLPYYELDWESEDPCRVLKPDLKVRTCRGVNEPAYKIIKEYLDGEFESMSFRDSSGNVQTIESREACFFVNSVNNIIGIIKHMELKPDQCNVIIADTPDNKKKLRKRLGRKWEIGKVPLKGDPHKMFTFCTRTVYLGADFYSTNARTFVLSDANIDTLSVDISLDLPQILGRQRNNSNPWKNRAEFYYKSTKDKVTKEDFDNFIQGKLKKTEELLVSYQEVTNKHTLAELYKRDTNATNYKFNYVAINEHSGKDMFPELNRLVLIAERRAFDIQQIDYKDRFSVFNTLVDQNLMTSGNDIKKFLEDFNTLPDFSHKMKALCNNDFNENERLAILDQIPLTYKTYYLTLGPERCKAHGYNVTDIRREYEDVINGVIREKVKEEKKEEEEVKVDEEALLNNVYNTFQVGEFYSNKDVKKLLGGIYSNLDYKACPKASELDKYFKVVRARKSVEGKQIEGVRILEKL